jgi:hypothetical protein
VVKKRERQSSADMTLFLLDPVHAGWREPERTVTFCQAVGIGSRLGVVRSR